MSSSAGRRTSVSRRATSWGAFVARAQRCPSARNLELALAAALIMPGCLLEPLAIGPGDELSDDLSSSGEVDSSSASSESTDSESTDSESSSSESTESSESDTTSETGDPPDPCGPQGALPEDGCETLLGYYWDGATCLALNGCGCGDDCPPLFESPVDCWLAYQICGPSPCAGLDEPSCMADPLCAARHARPVALDIDMMCLAPPIYAGCGLNTFCAATTTYACHVLDPDAAHQFANACLPEFDWFPCEPPQADPIPDCP